MTVKFQKSRPICKCCNQRPSRILSERTKLGFIRYGRICEICHEAGWNEEKSYRLHKKTYCEECGFVAVNFCQLDVDHIDGDHKNNDPGNLQTLCANCHRLKTYLNKDTTTLTQSSR